VVITPHLLMALYVGLARILGRRVVIDQIFTYVEHREVFPCYPPGLDRWAHRRAHAVLTHSETMRRELIAQFGLDPARVEVAYPVVDLTLFSRRWEDEAARARRELGIKDRFVVMYHGMWHPWHGLDYLYEAARLLRHRDDIVFVVIPRDGEPDRENLLFVDKQPFTRLPIYLQMADVWCSGFDTNVRGERTFSSTLIQALALGLPVITGSAGERAAVLRDGVEARLVPLRDAPAVAQAIVALEADRSGAQALGRRGRAFAEAHFSIDRLDRALARALGEPAAEFA
jgi:glycosyltransferase involved in cell wall biosynthesis